MFPTAHFIFLGAILFSIGITIVVVKRNMIIVLLGIELMLNASVLNLVAFNQIHPQHIDGQMFGLFVIVIAVCEAAVGLAIIIQVYRYYQTSIPEDVNELGERG
ncbi:MAG TPA: NADH-quinone oxidoreductase subunit NuoK [Chryseolinea sp.]|nr:NADH-quinone oxidoreductase subunit NuoK [Chryseolinea sp.]